jgi:hypothetical protein
MTTDEAKQMLALYLSGTELARRWDYQGLAEGEWTAVKRDLEDVLLGQFEVSFGNGTWGMDPQLHRLFRDSEMRDRPIGVGTAENMNLMLVPRA